MQNALRKWLVGTGLLVLLLAFAVPALAQNQWTASTTTFPQPVQAMAQGTTWFNVGTYGGGFPGGTNGGYYYDNSLPFGDVFSGPMGGANVPQNDDLTTMLYDSGTLFVGTWNTGLYQWQAGWTHLTLPPYVNVHITSLAIDSTVAPGLGIPHMLYVGTWGGAVYSYDGATWTKIPSYFDPGTYPAAQFIHKIAVVPSSGGCPPGQPLTIYAATDGFGVVKGVYNCVSGTWSWSQVGSLGGDDAYVYALALDGSNVPYIGTRSGHIYYWGSGTWNALTFSPAITSPVKDIAFDGMNGLFAATWGQGVFRYNFVKAAGAAINTGYGGWNLTWLYDSVLVWDGPNTTLYVGAGDMGGPGAQGKVFRITFTPIGNCEPANYGPITACVYDSNTVCLTNNQNPKNWAAMVTSGALPQGLSLGVNNTPTPPVVTISGTPTEDCTIPFTVSVWDSLLNQTDVPITYTILLNVSFTVDPNPAPLGTIQAFTSTVCGATGTVSYAWNFGDGAPLPAVDSTLPNPTHIYAAGGIYTVTLTVTDSACPGTADNTYTDPNVVVYAPLTVDPTATVTGSGAQFQFYANDSGGDSTCGLPYTYHWEFTDQFTHAVVGTSDVENPVITFAYTGSFVGTVTVTDCAGNTASGSCTVNYNGPMSTTIAVDVNPVPDDHAIQFTITAQGCGLPGLFLLDFDPGDGSGPVFSIPPSFVIGGIATWVVPYFPPTVASLTTFTATATVHDGPGPLCGHTTVITYDWKVYPHFDHITITPSGWTCPPNPGGHVPQTVSFNVTPSGGLPPYLYSVDWGDGTTTGYPNNAGGLTISHTYTTAGVYTITVYATDSGFYTVTLNSTYGPFTVGNQTLSHITATGSNQGPPCQQYSTTQPVNYTLWNDTVLSPGVLATDFTYDFWFGDEAPLSPPSVSGVFATNNFVVPGHLYGAAGTYTATLQVHNNITCETSTSTFMVTIYNPLLPPAAPTWQQSCGSRLVTFTAIAPTTGIGPYTYIWDFGDGTPPVTTTGPTTTHTFANSGNYNCQLTVIDSVCADGFHNTVNTPFIIRVVDPITVSIATSYTPTCAPSTAYFWSNVTGGGISPPDPNPDVNYQWSYTGPGGAVFSTPNSWDTNFTMNAAGTYNVTLTVQSTTVPGYTCTSNTVTVVAYGGITPGSFSFTQTETSGYLPLNDTFTTTWMMGGTPSAPVTLTYSWGDGTADTVVNNAVSPDYTQHTFEIHSGALGWLVTVTAVDSCGNTESMSRRIVILEPPALGVTTSVNPTAGIAPLTAAFTSIPTGGVPPYTFAWTFGDGGTSTDQNPTHIYAAAGNYTASLTVTDSWPALDGGPKTATATVSVTVYDPLTVNATGTPTAGSKPLTVGFTATPAGGSANKTYFWYFGDGANSTLQNPSHVYNTSGTYFAYVVVSDDASHTATSNQVVINVYDPLVITANATPSQGTKPLAVTFTAQANGGDNNYTYSWTFGDGGTGNGALVNHTYTAAGTYTANVHVVDGVGHSADKPLTVEVWDPLTASITGAKQGTGDYVPMTYNFASAVAGGNGTYTYSWNFGDGSTSAAANPSHTYTTAGTYAVTLVVSDTASHAVTSNTINITLYAPLAVSASATPSTLIVGNSVTFNAVATGGNGVYSFNWTFGDGSTGTGATVNHTYATKGTYTAFVVVTDGASHTVTSSNITITVLPVPPAIITAQKLTNPFRIRLLGTNFQSGCTATINGTPVTVKFKNGGKIILKNCKSLCPKGVPVQIVVTNPDGGVSNPFQFVR